jgi:ABC-type phosphate transport system auxiliary subunit
LLGHDTLVVLNQIEQQVEHLRLQRLRLALDAKLTAGRVQLELVENDCHAADFQGPR